MKKKKSEKITKAETVAVKQPPYSDHLAVKLTQAEERLFGKELAANDLALTDLDLALASFKIKIKGEITPIADRMKHLARCIRDGEEHRPVDVQWTHDFKSNTATLTRLDTGEIVRERPLRASELQASLPTHDDESGVQGAGFEDGFKCPDGDHDHGSVAECPGCLEPLELKPYPEAEPLVEDLGEKSDGAEDGPESGPAPE